MNRVIAGLLVGAMALFWPVTAFADAALPDPAEVIFNSPLVWVLAIGVIIVAVAVLIFVIRKRRK